MKKRIFESSLTYYTSTFEMDAPAPILTTDIVRKVGGYVDVDFNLISPAAFYDGLKVEQEQSGSDITQLKMKDWAMYGNLAWTNLRNNPKYYSPGDIEEQRIRKFIRKEILDLDEAANRKVYIKPGEKAPKGAKVSKGSRGGQYYYTKTADKRTKRGTRDLPGKPEKTKYDKFRDQEDKADKREKDMFKRINKKVDAHMKDMDLTFKDELPDDKKAVNDYADKVIKSTGHSSFFDKDPKQLNTKDLKRTVKDYESQIKRRAKHLKSQEKKGFAKNMLFARMAHAANVEVVKRMADKLEDYQDALQTKSGVDQVTSQKPMKTESKHGVGDKVKFNKPLYNKAGRQIGQDGGKIVDVKNYAEGDFYIVKIKGKKYQFPEERLIKQ